MNRLNLTAAGLVASVVATISYLHLHTVALAAGGNGLVAAIYPLGIDGAAVVAASTLWHDRRAGRESGLAATALLGITLAASLAANVAAPFLPAFTPAALVWLAAVAWALPPVVLALVTELVFASIPEKAADQRKQESADTAAAPADDLPPHVADVAARLRDGADLTGAAVGQLFQKSERWGRDVLKAARAAA